jgi:menaquinone-specific isochorismate synthase
MPVLPYRSDLFEKCKIIYQFLSDCQQQAVQAQHAKLANISFALSPMTPWAVLEQFGKPRQVYFYYDNAAQGQSLVALDAVLTQQAQGSSRFARVQQFIDVWRRRILCSEKNGLPFSQPHFFCGFSFFDQVSPTDSYEAAQVFVPRLQVATHGDRSTVSFNCLVDDAVNVVWFAEEIGQQLQALHDLANRTPLPERPRTQRARKVTRDVEAFRQTVATALQPIREQQLHKVVLAEAMEVLSSTSFRVPASLRGLRQTHPDCYVFAIGNGHGQEFIGASPERLLSIQRRQLVTDALAGSAPRGTTVAADAALAQRLLNSQKEGYEHRVVVEFIVQQLRQLGLTPAFSEAPALLQLSNIQHLHTPIRAQLSADLEPLAILAQLHPTPAVAGLPRAAACALIQQAESFQRELYAAPLGWVDAAGNSEFIVGIRSALVDGRQARLYAGAGIVSGSDPDRELAEIQLKLQALLGALV